MKRKVPWKTIPVDPASGMNALPKALLRLADWVVRTADREHPADRVLRETLKTERGLSQEERTSVSRAVFAYYRWRGWVGLGEQVERGLAEALELQGRFQSSPRSFRDAELLARAIPGWARGYLETIPAWVRSLQGEPRVWLRSRPGRVGELIERLGSARRVEGTWLPEAVEYLGREDLFVSPEFRRGDFELQDIASQVVGRCCDPRPGQTWWDACAGEGGKTLHLSDLMENRGLIVATDRSGWRLRKLKQRAARARVFNYRTKLWVEEGRLPIRTPFDGVLVDAPCSGLGTWQRNPHARWTCQPGDVRELSQVQWRLLTLAASAVKPGGKLVYAVCTMTRMETEEMAGRFSREHPQFKPMPMMHPFQGGKMEPGRMTLWPQDSGGNGMFVAAWRKGQPASQKSMAG